MSFETEMMDDLFFDAAEGPSQSQYDDFDALDDNNDEFMRTILGGLGNLVGGMLGGGNQADEFDAAGDVGDTDVGDAMEAAVADALQVDGTDEFLQNIAGVARGLFQTARNAVPLIGRAARLVAPIASVIPGVGSVAGPIAGILSNLAADGADDLDALDEMFALADAGDLDAAGPVISGLTLRTLMPQVRRLPPAQRRALVRSVNRATRTLAARQAHRAVPQVVRLVQQGVARRRIAPTAMPRAIRQTATRLVQNPRTLRRLVQLAPRRLRRPYPRPYPQQLRLRGPVTITIQSR